MDFFLVSEFGDGPRLRECLAWLAQIPGRRLRVMDDYVDRHGRRVTYLKQTDACEEVSNAEG